LVWLVALCTLGTANPLPAAQSLTASGARATPQGRTWDSIKRLPDWSGVWVLTDESWTEFIAAVRPNLSRVPLTPTYAAMRATNDVTEINNETRCIPMGMPDSLAIPIGHEYLFTPGRVTMVFENGIVRRIDTSGHPHPPERELTATFAGHSIGRWEGKTLVVDTIGLVSQASLLFTLHATERTHLTERIFRKGRDTLQIDSVITDPEIFTEPWRYARLYKRSAGAPLEYYPCVDGARDKMTNGVLSGVDLTPPPPPASKP
jgi:hypothetical protein